MLIPKPLILFIDAYDSFSNNIISLLETTLDASVRTIYIDNPALFSDEALHKELQHYAAVVCGPGPGHPGNERDVGLMRRIWRLADKEMVPVLGICLGFQSLCLEFGGKVRRLQGPQHGIVRRILHIGEAGEVGETSIFGGVGVINATLYQSLCADIGQDSIRNDDWENSKWQATKQCPDLLPLAWVEHDLAAENDSGIMDERVLVAVRHRTKPFWTVQYHPESICTNRESTKVILNWFKAARSWSLNYRRTEINLEGPIEGRFATRESLLSQSQRMSETFPANGDDHSTRSIYHSRSIDIPAHLSVQAIAEAVLDMREEQIILESSNANQAYTGGADVRGRYSIIGLDIRNCTKLQYRAGGETIAIIHPQDHIKQPHVQNIDASSYGGIWPYLAQYLELRKVKDGKLESPFWGGFMGYTTYELGLETIGVTPDVQGRQHDRPDLCFAWVEKSLVIDHVKNQIYIQQLAAASEATHVASWMDNIATKLRSLMRKLNSLELGGTVIRAEVKNEPTAQIIPTKTRTTDSAKSSPTPNIPSSVLSIQTPNNGAYESKVLSCQSSIRAGDSYELCLTDQTHITLSKSPSSAWSLYTTLRTRQPAPFASYIQLGDLTYISASPERFLSYTPTSSELRPMKGTVRKSPEVATLAEARLLLDVPKEKAENLMIVDLVRHDLHGVCGAGNVSVPRLMVVEEYASVFQMISIVQATIPQAFPKNLAQHVSVNERFKGEGKRYTGLDVLAASLPPGSMTGAPKKRSCEILQSVEQGRQRSLYSGVVGYAGVGGRGDWSVNIRCAFRWEDEDEGQGEVESGNGEEGEQRNGRRGEEIWHIGAGGAVTALSTPVGEREEMLTKLSGTLGLFR
ncbi:hypothetical protein VTL71DRAFT_15809 [Oculimacula yallundae]|uniref:aminodeoxychorismate synthase n=1 Tax=Oculimacula yallundae TaxID=86028 RepID=A0ABR4CCQ9_9HELO